MMDELAEGVCTIAGLGSDVANLRYKVEETESNTVVKPFQNQFNDDSFTVCLERRHFCSVIGQPY